jgi:hypothetical protein
MQQSLLKIINITTIFIKKIKMVVENGLAKKKKKNDQRQLKLIIKV